MYHLRPDQAPVAQKMDSAIHRINLSPVEKPIGETNCTPSLDRGLSCGYHQPSFEQLGSG